MYDPQIARMATGLSLISIAMNERNAIEAQRNKIMQNKADAIDRLTDAISDFRLEMRDM